MHCFLVFEPSCRTARARAELGLGWSLADELVALPAYRSDTCVCIRLHSQPCSFGLLKQGEARSLAHVLPVEHG